MTDHATLPSPPSSLLPPVSSLTEELTSPLRALDDDTRTVLLALAMLWNFHERLTVVKALKHLAAKTTKGKAFDATTVAALLQKLEKQDLAVVDRSHKEVWRVRPSVQFEAYELLLDSFAPATLKTAISATLLQRSDVRSLGFEERAAIFRVSLLTGVAQAGLTAVQTNMVGAGMSQADLWDKALPAGTPDTLLCRIDPLHVWPMAQLFASRINRQWRGGGASLVDYAQRLLVLDIDGGRQLRPPQDAASALVENLVYRGKVAQAERVALYLDEKERLMVQALCHFARGNWQEVITAFAQAVKLPPLRNYGNLLGGLEPYYVLALLAAGGPADLTQALKFVQARQAATPGQDIWGIWSQAIRAKQGTLTLPAGWSLMPQSSAQDVDMDDVWRVLMRAWLGSRLVPAKMFDTPREHALEIVRARLKALDMPWLLEQLDNADAVYMNGEAATPFFCAADPDNWRSTLALLQSLVPSQSNATARESRILWALSVGPDGALLEVAPLLQSKGVRGNWNKPKAMKLSTVAGHKDLNAEDHKVLAQAFKTQTSFYKQGQTTVDFAKAAIALVGHPNVVLMSDPGTLVTLTQSAPELEVLKEGDHLVVRVTPPARKKSPDYPREQDAEALALLTVVRDSASHVRLVQMNMTQYQAAVQLTHQLRVPQSAEAEVTQMLGVLGTQFQVHADHAEADHEQEAETRLRAELSPAGQGLTLRLVATPLGLEGPRFTPGQGRARVQVKATRDGVTHTTGTRRDLALEQDQVDAVMEALPFLDEGGKGSALGMDCEWTVDDLSQALEMVERLPALDAVSGIDWPKGKSMRTVRVAAIDLGLRISTGNDWFKLSGSVQVEEGKVLSLQDLLASSRQGRYIQMGDGLYAALTQDLQAKLSDLNAVAEKDKDGAKVPQLAAEWLQEILNGTQSEVDPAFEDKCHRLEQAQALTPTLPTSLQAELRPYQQDGFAWMTRLAHAGFGACLADDMGLGKTLQSLAVLLTRAADGAALIVAPTSVCGNWIAETLRFAPSLNVSLFSEYADTERQALVEKAGAMDVIVVSYAMLVQSADLFKSRAWNTVVLDEAQAIKNPAAKRTLTVFELEAGFRLALSGTPVENRLAELWSIMRFCNPGLLSTLTRFVERFATPIERHQDRDAQRLLRRLISPFILRRTKAQVLTDLPPRTELTMVVEAQSDEVAHYEALRRRAVEEAMAAQASLNAGQAKFNVLGQLTKLRRAACDPRLVTPSMGPGAKVEEFVRLAQELAANGHKTLVFSQFVDFLELLRQSLDGTGLSYQYLDGSTPSAERTKRVAEFQAGNGDFFFISLKAGGAGLNLTAADYIVIADPWWNPAVEDQAMGRAHRIGQQRPVTAYRLVNKGTVEEGIISMHADKRALADGILDGGEGAALPSTDDLIALMRG